MASGAIIVILGITLTFLPHYYSALRQAVNGHEMNRIVVRSSYTNYATGWTIQGLNPGIS